ncbi:MAG TPA: GNAT family N-acetyltransferase, partial [Noviherbaspirillum sp.]|nr:GNAT family N-acetyltransferase [Noviherbaspirillum sp.]
MDKHYLTPLFSPRSIVVFAGNPEAPDTQTAQARLLVEQLRAGGFAGPVTYLDIGMSGTLSELAQSRSDLALIALPNDQLVAALEVAGRIESKAALIVSNGVDAALGAELHAIARRHGIYLLGPNSAGFQRPRQHINASVLGPMAQEGSLALVSQSGALTASILDWAVKNRVGFSS